MSWQWKLKIEDCTGCGICCDICPEKAIKMSRDMAYPEPVRGRCNGCLKCIRQCPFEAIEVLNLEEHTLNK